MPELHMSKLMRACIGDQVYEPSTPSPATHSDTTPMMKRPQAQAAIILLNLCLHA